MARSFPFDPFGYSFDFPFGFAPPFAKATEGRQGFG